ncbi:MAG: hypothetical protein MJ137_02465 [Clostridia bacterium]|nr:hypothetical protein [Clostridia bacterium]
MRKTLSIVLSIIMVVSLFCFGVSAAEAEKITSAEAFAAMKADGNYVLDADIVVAASYGAGETPVPFTGTLDGNGHTVTVTAPMFASLAGTVKNLTIEGEVTSDSSVGALASIVSAEVIDDLTAYAVVENVTNKANVTMNVPDTAEAAVVRGVGGFVGSSEPLCGIMFIGCTNEGAVTLNVGAVASALSKTYAGGFAGACDTFLARECTNKGNITAETDSAKLAGETAISGFIGRAAFTASMNYVNIEYCVNEGNCTGSRRAGGFLGYSGLANNYTNYDMGNTPYRFYANINKGDMTANEFAGGIAGYIYSTGGDANETFDIKFNLTSGTMTSKKWCSPFVGYSNSICNVMQYNIANVTLAHAEGASDWQFVFLGCSSADYRNDAEIHDNYIVGAQSDYQWLCYAESDSNEAKRIPIAYGVENNYVKFVAASDFSTGKLCHDINKAAGVNAFNQTLGSDELPTPAKTSSYVVLDGSTYKNSTTPDFEVLEVLDITTEEVTTKAPTTAKQTTEKPVETSAPAENTTASAGEATTVAPAVTTAPAPAKNGCGGSVIGIGVALVAVLGAAYVSKKEF